MSQRLRNLLICSLSLVLLTASAFANELAPFLTVTNTDYAAFGVGGIRVVGSGTITVTNITPQVKKAYLYWVARQDTNTTIASPTATVLINGSSVTGTNIGATADDCWGPLAYNQAYRADVTAKVAATGNGNYLLSNFNPGAANVNGASLMVFYDDGNPNNNNDILIYDGNDSNAKNIYDRDGWNAAFSGFVSVVGKPFVLQMHVSDGQFFNDASMLINGNVADPLTLLGQTFQGLSVPCTNNKPGILGVGPYGNGGLWDIKDFDVSRFIVSGQNSLLLTTTTQVGDCLSLIAAVMKLPVGSASTGGGVNPPPVNHVPTVTCSDAILIEATATTGLANPSFSATIADSDGDAINVVWSVDLVPVKNFALPPGGGVATFSQFIAPGNHTVTVSAMDTKGGLTLCGTAVTILDPIPPVVNCGADVIVTANPDGTIPVPDFVGPTVQNINGPAISGSNAALVKASDNSVPPLTLQLLQYPAAGTLVGVGTNIIQVVVNDEALNQSVCTRRYIVKAPVLPPPPQATNLTLTCTMQSTMMWPPNHDMIDVGFAVTANQTLPTTAVKIEVWSDEAESELGAGNFSHDAQMTSDGRLLLRRERSGLFDGRVYLVIAKGVNPANGQSNYCVSAIGIPHDQSAASISALQNQIALAIATYCSTGSAPQGYFKMGKCESNYNWSWGHDWRNNQNGWFGYRDDRDDVDDDDDYNSRHNCNGGSGGYTTKKGGHTQNDDGCGGTSSGSWTYKWTQCPSGKNKNK